LSPDPYVPDPLNTQSFNRYSYLYNNPMNGIDPSGYSGVSPDFNCSGSGLPYCIYSWGKFILSFFGGHHYPKPPPNWCKDNTRGCGFVADLHAEVFASDKVSLPVGAETGTTDEPTNAAVAPLASGGEDIKIVISVPVKELRGLSTMATNGRGGLEVYIDPDLDPREVAAETAHEQRHIDWVMNDATNIEILENQPAHLSIKIRSSDKYHFAFEIAGHRAAIEVLKQQLNYASPVDRKFFEEAIKSHEVTIYTYEHPMQQSDVLK